MKAKGFTLIELLVVITIIGILATGATAIYSGAQAKARDSVRLNDVASIGSAMNFLNADNDGSYTITGGASALQSFLDSTPVPPVADNGDNANDYVVNSNSTTYGVYACGMKTGTAQKTTGDVATVVSDCTTDGSATIQLKDSAAAELVAAAGIINY